jgi:divalent metal cation (Fe/Co/Zn/Cd) transporter
MNVALASRQAAVRKGLVLEYLTVSWNSAEAVIALVAGFLAGSIALVGFGFDSVIEVTSGIALLWRLHFGEAAAKRERAEAVALRVVGVSFLALAAYVAYEAVAHLVAAEAPDASLAGIVLAGVSLIVMPLLARAKRGVASRIQSAALTADARQTDLCAYLSAILLGGLTLNAAFGWWWADPVAGLVMTPIIAKEGWEAIRGKTCCCTEPSCHPAPDIL